jgi:hypothetical protein
MNQSSSYFTFRRVIGWAVALWMLLFGMLGCATNSIERPWYEIGITNKTNSMLERMDLLLTKRRMLLNQNVAIGGGKSTGWGDRDVDDEVRVIWQKPQNSLKAIDIDYSKFIKADHATISVNFYIFEDRIEVTHERYENNLPLREHKTPFEKRVTKTVFFQKI